VVQWLLVAGDGGGGFSDGFGADFFLSLNNSNLLLVYLELCVCMCVLSIVIGCKL